MEQRSVNTAVSNGYAMIDQKMKSTKVQNPRRRPRIKRRKNFLTGPKGKKKGEEKKKKKSNNTRKNMENTDEHTHTTKQK